MTTSPELMSGGIVEPAAGAAATSGAEVTRPSPPAWMVASWPAGYVVSAVTIELAAPAEAAVTAKEMVTPVWEIEVAFGAAGV